MGLTNDILLNVIGRFFHHLPWGGEGNNSQVKVIKSNQEIRLINPDKIIEPINPNKRMGSTQSSKDIQS